LPKILNKREVEVVDGKNTPAYYDAATITAVKSFIVLAQVAKTSNFLL
jgi:hypothetical protein